MNGTFRFFSGLTLGCLLICGGFVFVLFTVYSYPQLAGATQTLWSFGEKFPSHRTTLPTLSEITLVRVCLGLGLFLLFLTGWRLQHKYQVLSEFGRQTVSGCRQVFSQLWQQYRQLSPFQKRVISGFFLLITGLRIYYAFVFPLHPDESVSAIAFADRGLLAVTSLYPIPNNHIFYNLLAWVFSWFITDYFWLSRVPALVISLVFLVFSFGILLRFTTFPVALLSTVLFGLHHNSLYYASHGRGYYLLTFFAVTAAFSLLQIFRKRPDFYWLFFVLASILGFYTTVTFVYTFAGFLLAGGLFYLYKKDVAGLIKLTLASALTGFCVLLLLLPLFVISGPGAMFNHNLLEPLSFQAFFLKLPRFVWYISGACLGQETIGFYVYLLLMLAFGIIWLKRAKIKRLLPQVSDNFTLLGFIALAVGVAPLFVMLAQRIFPYERLLVYKSFFDLVLLSLVLVLLLTRWLKNSKKVTVAVIAIGLLFGLYHTYKINEVLHLDKQSCPPDTIQRALNQYGDPDKPMRTFGQ